MYEKLPILDKFKKREGIVPPSGGYANLPVLDKFAAKQSDAILAAQPAAPAADAPAPPPPTPPASSLGELATWANRATQPQSRRDLESQWPTSPPKPVIAPAGPAAAPAAASAPVIPSMPSDAPKVNPLLQGGEMAAEPTAPTAAVNPILEPTKQPLDGSIPEWWQPGGSGKPPEPNDTRPVMQRLSDWMTKDTYLNQQAESLATLVMDFIPSTIRGVRGNTKMFLESAFGEKNAKRIGKYSKWTMIGPITGDFKGFDKLLDKSGNLRAEAKARLMAAAKEQGGMTGAVIAGVSEGIVDTILALKTMQALKVGYGQEAVKTGAPWFAKSWSVVKAAAIRSGIMTARTPHDNPKEFAKAYGISLAYQSTPAISRHFKDTASVIAADIALNSAITATQVEGLIGDAWKQAEAEGGTPDQVDSNAAIYATISMIQAIGSDIVFGAMTRSFKNAPPPVRDALEQAKAQAEKVGNDLPTAKPMPVPVDDSVRGPETNPMLATPERPVLISNQPDAARGMDESTRISSPDEPIARVNPLLEPEKVQQAPQINTALADQLDGVRVETEAARPAEQVAAPEAARPPIEQARAEAGAPRQAPPTEPTRDSAPLATRYTPEQLAEMKAAQEKRVGEMGEKPAQGKAKRQTEGAAVFSRDEIVVGKPQTSRRTRPNGTDGETKIRIDAPSSITSPENWQRLADFNKTSATVEARIDFESGRAAKKTDLSWTVRGKDGSVIASKLTQKDAIEAAKDYVNQSNRQAESAPREAQAQDAAKPPELMSPDKLPEYAARAIREDSAMLRTNKGGSITALDPHKNSKWGLETVEIKNLAPFDSDFVHRGSMTKGPIVINGQGEVIDGNNRLYEATKRGDKTIEAFVQKEISASAVEKYGMKLPPGYTREGDLYVFKGEAQGDVQGDKPAPRTASDLARPIADPAKGAVTETVKGITELFKPDLGKLGSGPFVFDEGKYAKAKVHFERDWVEAKAAGNSIKEFADWAVRQFGDVIRPYIGRFVEEESSKSAPSGRIIDPDTGREVTGLAKKFSEPERKALGYPEYVVKVSQKWPDVVDEAWGRISEADDLVREINANPRTLSPVESAMFEIKKVELYNARNEAARLMDADPENRDLASRFTDAQNRLEQLFDANSKAGTEWGRAGKARQMTMDEQFDVVNLEMAVRAAKGGKPITDGERAYLEKIAADYKTERDVYSKQVEEAKVYTAEIETKLRGIEDQILYERIIREVEPKLTSVGTETLVELSQGGRLYANPIDPERVLSIAKWMLGKMAKGVRNPSDLAVKHLGDEAKPVIDAAREKALELVRERQAKGGPAGTGKPKAKPTGEPSPSEQIRALYKAQVEAGVRDVNEATRNVTSEWNKTHDAEKQMTETQVRDTFSDYGKVTPLTKDEVKKVLAELRREAQLTSSIERAASNLHPLKTGKQRFPPSAEARALTKTLNNMLKEKGLDAVDPERQLKSIMDARKTRMLDAIEDKKRAIETMTRIPANKKPPEYDAEAKVLKAELDKITEEYNRIFPKDVKTFTPEERLAVATKAAERSLKMATDELNAARKGIFADKKRYPDLPHNAYLEGLRAQRKIAAQEVKELRELAFPGQKAIKDRIKRLESSIRLYEHKLAVGDFTPRKPHQIDITDNPMAMLQKARMEVLKHEFAVAKEEARYNALSRKGKFKEQRNEFFRNTFNYFRNIKSSYDFSGVGRQGGLMMLSNPVLWAKSLPNAFKVYGSEKDGFEYWEKFQKRQNFDLYKKAELGISPGDGRGNFGPADDIFRPDIASRVPLVKRHMRSFSVVLNEFRANLFDKLLAASKDPSDLSEEKIKAIASLANSWTGRGPLPKGISAESLGYIFWAPRFVSSAVDVSTKPFRMVGEAALDRITGSEKYDREMRAMWWKQYGRLTAGMAALYATAYAMHVVEYGNDDEFYIETDPTSAKFGDIKIPFGNHNVNPFNFVRPTLTFLARAITGEMKTAQRKKMQLAPWAWSAEAREAGYGQRGGIKETLYDFAQTKQNPFYNSALQIATGKDFYGGDMNRLWAVISGIAPLVPSSMPNLFKAEVGTNWDNIDLERIPVFLMAGTAAIFGNQPRASDYKAPRQLKITSTKENYAKAIAGAVMKGTAEAATPESKQYLKSFVTEEGEKPLFDALDAEFDKRRSEQKTYEARMRWIKRSYDTSGNITYYGIRRRNLKRIIKEANAETKNSK